MGRSGPTDEEQLGYIDTRIEDLKASTTPVSIDEIPVKFDDINRFFHGDGPAQEFEEGQQKGGHYQCVCGIDVRRNNDLVHAFRIQPLSMSEKKELVTSGYTWKTKNPGKVKPYQNLKVDSLRKELSSRGQEYEETALKDELKESLDKILHGMQRVHSLLYKNEDEDLSKINCKNYETLKAEPLHDIKGHAKNILDELPHLVSKVERDELEKFIQAALGNADEVRGSDIRKAVILVTKYIEDKQVRGKVSEDISTLMKTLAEISHISYLHDVYRCPKRVLRLYNITFLHGLLCIKLISKPKTMTQRKFYGRYYHNVVVHLPEQYRIISLYSSNTESQERVFNAIRRITKSTSSNGLEKLLEMSSSDYMQKKKQDFHLSHLILKFQNWASLFPLVEIQSFH
ncbi:uncharacterized protein [Ptychodera flava]|uniref:uncharacterized protein n=1 Tax=Ptychodera flava TaxID=63121 RepID=UPI00396A4313